jgi:uncharacterized protein (DUF983 family)
MKEKSALEAIIQCKCPRCRQGDMFTDSAFSLTKFADMPSHCSECNLRYAREPGFFDGSMYISYAFSVAIMLTSGVATYVIGNDPDAWVYITVVAVAILFFFRFTFRYSRTLMLHLFGGIKYEPESIERHQHK